jgi:GTP cyclohydrolase I
MSIHDLDDVQNRLDTRNLSIDKAGIKNLNYPTLFKDIDDTQLVVGSFDLAVHVQAQQKGAHLSRFTSLLQQYHEKDSLVIGLETLPLWHKRMLNQLEAEQGSFSCSFKFFIQKTAPVSGQSSLMDYELTLSCEGKKENSVTTISLSVPVTSLCPCSKEISKYGAHNQRSIVTVTATTASVFSIKGLTQLIEQEASCELFNLLKRVDEKYVTEKAYENPKFSEDIVRDAFIAIKASMPFLTNLSIVSEHLESIHSHNAYAKITDRS